MRARNLARTRGASLKSLWGGRLRRPLDSSLQNRSKNQVSLIPPIVPEAVLVQAGLQILLRNGVIDSGSSPLHQRPESFDGIGVNECPHHVHLGAVIDPPMHILIAMPTQIIVDREIVGIDAALRQNLLFDDTHDGNFL